MHCKLDQLHANKFDYHAICRQLSYLLADNLISYLQEDNSISYLLADNSVICMLRLRSLFCIVLVSHVLPEIGNKTVIGFDFGFVCLKCTTNNYRTKFFATCKITNVFVRVVNLAGNYYLDIDNSAYHKNLIQVTAYYYS